MEALCGTSKLAKPSLHGNTLHEQSTYNALEYRQNSYNLEYIHLELPETRLNAVNVQHEPGALSRMGKRA